MLRLLSLVALLLATAGAASACSGGESKPSGSVCEPGKIVYCRCPNGVDEGEQQCREDGNSFERCEPCYEYDDTDDFVPEDDDAPTDRDASTGPRCGDGVVDPGESCDDGNTDPNDGCDDCKAGGDPLTGTACPGITVHLWDEAIEIDGSSAQAGNAHTGLECDGITGGAAPDRVYTVIPHRDGTLRVEVLAAFDTALFLYSTCDDIYSKLSCSITGSLTLQQVLAEVPLSLTVDGHHSSDKGKFRLRLSWQ